MNHPKKRNVAILLFDDVEVLDFAGPFEVFSVTSELNNYELFNVYTVATVATNGRTIRAVNGLSVNADHQLAEAPAPDIIIVPGGVGTRKMLKDQPTVDWIRQHAATAELVVSICTGALVLARAGLLENAHVTTHHEALDLLAKLAPTATICPNDRFTDNGHILTAGGISAGIDLSLHIIQRLHGPATRHKTMRYMEYGDWRQEE